MGSATTWLLVQRCPTGGVCVCVFVCVFVSNCVWSRKLNTGRPRLGLGRSTRKKNNIQGVLKNRTFAVNNLLLILNTVPLKVVPSTGNTPFPGFLALLKCFPEHTFCDGAQFSYRIFLNILYGLEMTSFQSGFNTLRTGEADLRF